MNKYKVRKLLTVLVIVSLILGPIIFIKVEKAIEIMPMIKIARTLEAYESNLDVVNVITSNKEPTKVLIVVLLDNQSYWSQSSKIWTNLIAFTFKIIKENGYESFIIISGWLEGQVEYESRCESRVVDCLYRPIDPQAVLTPWLGKGKP